MLSGGVGLLALFLLNFINQIERENYPLLKLQAKTE